MEGFAGIQLSTYLDAFDWERSEYQRDEVFPDEVYMIDKLVLKEVPLPPLFRLAARPVVLMVSAQARAAMEKAKIRGVRFKELSEIF